MTIESPTGSPSWSLGILAGGFSRRMGSCKADLTTPSGLSFVTWMGRRLAPPSVPVWVGTRSDGPGRDAGFPWVDDELPGEGPLSSIVALLSVTRTTHLLVVPTDMPLLPPDLGIRMLARAQGEGGVLVDDQGVVDPFPALIPRRALEPTRALLMAGERRASAWRATVEAVTVPAHSLYPDRPWAEVAANVNTPEDYDRVQDKLRRLGSR